MPTSLCVQERVPAATFPDSPRGLRRGATLPHCANGARSPPSQEAGPGESFSVPPSASLAIFNLSNEPCYKYSLALVADQDTQERAAPPLRSLATPARHAPWLSLLCRPPARPLDPAPPCPPPPTGLATAPQAARWTSTRLLREARRLDVAFPPPGGVVLPRETRVVLPRGGEQPCDGRPSRCRRFTSSPSSGASSSPTKARRRAATRPIPSRRSTRPNRWTGERSRDSACRFPRRRLRRVPCRGPSPTPSAALGAAAPPSVPPRAPH